MLCLISNTEDLSMKKTSICVLSLSIVLSAPAYAGAGHVEKPISSKEKQRMDRWYHKSMVKRGEPLFKEHCASCHQEDASGGHNWHEKNAEGIYPAPPLNGTGHAWHHARKSLKKTIREGGHRLGGTMPGFKDKLNDREIDSLIAWFQSHWSDRIYDAWVRRN